MSVPANSASPFDGVQIKRANLSEQVAEQIQDMIIEGKLMPGDRLPPEREWAEQFGVSRTVIREVTKVLQDRGLVRILPGSGTYVSKLSPQTVTQAIGLYLREGKAAIHDLLEMRSLLEVQLVALAAQRADQDALNSLESATERMESALKSIRQALEGPERARAAEQFAAANADFHLNLARASGNRLATLVLEPIIQLLMEAGWALAMQTGGSEASPSVHRRIVDAIRKQDVEACREAMREDIGLTAAAWARLDGDGDLSQTGLL